MCVRLDSECLENNNCQKPCCNDLCEVAIVKELVDETVERDYTNATNVIHKKSL